MSLDLKFLHFWDWFSAIVYLGLGIRYSPYIHILWMNVAPFRLQQIALRVANVNNFGVEQKHIFQNKYTLYS